MRQTPAPWQHGVVLVCNNQRPDGAPKPSCGRQRGDALKAWLKGELREAGGAAAGCRVLTSSCLDICPADGVAVALLPQDVAWVVDPEADREALKAEIEARAGSEAGGEDGGGGRARRLLGKLRGR